MQFFKKFENNRKQKSLETESVNVRVLMDCLNQDKLNKLKEAISLSVFKRNILVIIYMKLFPLEEIFQKFWLSCTGFY